MWRTIEVATVEHAVDMSLSTTDMYPAAVGSYVVDEYSLILPFNFAMVDNGVFWSGFPDLLTSLFSKNWTSAPSYVRNHPFLIHCNRGKVCENQLDGVCRNVFDEYERFAAAKARVSGQRFMELFDVTSVKHLPVSFSCSNK
ncbi:hypothetical protein F3Y22_tig00111088pilonHSYRG00106 [Hibiscus syriacus]|uniref:Uncharacterized protein n=1 Tax=Hibiscus syriacus TaxID=106335 RepID=A0A6A2Z3D1_HIBSY|nr:hypothetical protein F3Y22_tig00111088pilonHSYRG00106 [Hibiscus syriacus]